MYEELGAFATLWADAIGVGAYYLERDFHAIAGHFLYLKPSGARDIKMLCLLAAPEGIKAFQEAHPGVPIITAAIDDHLNEHGYIVPGLGDAGDRIYGTK